MVSSISHCQPAENKHIHIRQFEKNSMNNTLIHLPTTGSFLKGILDTDSFSMRVQTVNGIKQDIRKDFWPQVSRTCLNKITYPLVSWALPQNPYKENARKHMIKVITANR